MCAGYVQNGAAMSAQRNHPWASALGASAVIDGSARRRVASTWRRLCMQVVAALGDMTLTW
eukprot:3973010-Pleurochrysis_carterae.AAC.1